jgi:hypothetical protein
VTSGSYTPLENEGFYGKSPEPSDYTGSGGSNDEQCLSADNSASNYSMKNNVSLSNSTLTGDVVFNSSWNANFYANGHDSNNDGVLDTNGGWIDDGLNVDELNITLDNGSKWTGAAIFSTMRLVRQICMTLQVNSLEPTSTYDKWGNVVDNKSFQSGLFNVALNNGSHWNTVNDSNIDNLTVNNGSHVDVANGSTCSRTTLR